MDILFHTSQIFYILFLVIFILLLFELLFTFSFFNKSNGIVKKTKNTMQTTNDDTNECFSTENYSLIILNWKRPKNVLLIVNELKKCDYINEIIISNGKESTKLSFPDEKIKCQDDFGSINDNYGLDRRFLNGLKATNQKLIIIDDDLFITCSSLYKIIDEYNKDTSRIVGIFGRNFSKDFSYDMKNRYGRVDIVLTRLLVMDKKLCSLFFYCRPMIQDIYSLGVPYGNGEDIFLSFISLLYYRRKNYCMQNIPYKNLSSEHAISSLDGHASYRTKLCKFLNEKKNELNLLISQFHNI